MKIPALVLTSLAFVAPSVAKSTTGGLLSPFDPESDPSLMGMDHHVFPATFVFEVKKDVPDSPELWALIQDAFLRSANEAHDESMMHFDQDTIVRVRHQKMKPTKEIGSLQEEPPAQGGLRAFASTTDSQTLDWRYYYGRQYRINYSNTIGVGCNFCTLDDDNFLAAGSYFATFYDSLEGQQVILDWQNRFCGYLDKISGVDKPTRCFISMDFDHEIFEDVEEPAFHKKN